MSEELTKYELVGPPMPDTPYKCATCGECFMFDTTRILHEIAEHGNLLKFMVRP